MNNPDPVLVPGTLEADKQVIAVLLAQFNACRGEILARSATQATLFNLNVTVSGVIAGYYFGSNANPLVLLVIPLISPMLGIIWADHAINIGNQGRFIQHQLMPRLSATLKHELPDYEASIRAFEANMGKRLVLLIAPLLLLFAVLPAAALVLAAVVTKDHTALFYCLAALGAALILVFGGFAVAILTGAVWPAVPQLRETPGAGR